VSLTTPQAEREGTVASLDNPQAEARDPEGKKAWEEQEGAMHPMV
jgi:hypothetical protein